jgi:uncharacterized membrane protein
MSEITVGIGSALSVFGLGAFLGAGRKHITALIPAFLGLPLLVLGLAGRREGMTRDAMHTATGVSALGVLVSLQGLLFPQLFPATAEADRPRRSLVQGITAALCGLHLVLAVKSFVGARRAE